MKLLLKRHPPIDPVTGMPRGNLSKEQEEAFPSTDQLDVGELAINTITGKLYTKLLDGSIVEFVSQKICFDPAPEISFFYENNPIIAPNYIVENFCCAGGLLTVFVDKLKPEPMAYNFYLQELTNNTVAENIILQPANFTTYSVVQNGAVFNYRKATIPITLSLLPNNFNKISLFQFKVADTNDKIIRGSERTLTIRCLEANL